MAVHDLPRPEKPPGTQSSSPETVRSKLSFGRMQVASARTRDNRLELQVGCLRNQRTRPTRRAVLPLPEIMSFSQKPISPNS